MARDQSRIIELQRSLKIAREALERIKSGHCGSAPHRIAEDALDRIWPLEQKQPLQGLVGHERRTSR